MRIYSVAAALLFAAAPLAAQREFVVQLYGGGADHLADLKNSPPAWFMPGYSVGGSVGVQLTNVVGVHGDFTYTRNPIEGSGIMAGRDVNRFFYGVHAEFRYPLRQWTPFAFAGAGAVTIDQLGFDAFDPVTKPALMYGAGVFYTIPATRLEMVGELKGLSYNWNMAGFHRDMVDVTYTVGLAYRFTL